MGNIFRKRSESPSKKSDNDSKNQAASKKAKRESNEALFNKIKLNIEILKAYDSDDVALYETKHTRELLLAIDDAYFSHSKVKEQITDVLLENHFLETVLPILQYYAEQGYVKRKETYLAAFNILNTIWSAAVDSLQFRRRIADVGYVRLLLCTLADSEFVQLMDINDRVKYIIQSTLAIFHNMSRSAELKFIFRETKALPVIIKFLNVNHPEVKALAHMLLANVATNDDDVSLIDNSKTIPFLVAMLDEAMRTPEKAFRGENAKFPAHIIIESLNKLSVEDKNRLAILECNGLNLLLNILKSLNVMKKEQQEAANCIWMLCYNDKIKKKIKESQQHYDAICKLAEASVNDELRVSCKGILMLLNNEIEKRAEEYKVKQRTKELSKLSPRPILSRQQAQEMAQAEQRPGHIMISYNKLSRETCLKIKARLDQQYDTWMDVHCIYGDALDSMADAIEKASIVLICMSEYYKESANCAIEAKYTLALRKPYVPLKMQSKYNPRGWLGMLLNYKIYIDFADKPFDDSFNMLMNEINHILSPNRRQLTGGTGGNTSSGTGSGSTATTSGTSSSKGTFDSQGTSKSTESIKNSFPAYSWNQAKVLEWLTEIKLENYKNSFIGFDGKRLYRLYDWKLRESQFYYNFLSETFETNNNARKTTDILAFEEELEKLFS